MNWADHYLLRAEALTSSRTLHNGTHVVHLTLPHQVLMCGMSVLPASCSGVGTLQALQTMKLELLYAAYFAYFAGSHTQGSVFHCLIRCDLI